MYRTQATVVNLAGPRPVPGDVVIIRGGERGTVHSVSKFAEPLDAARWYVTVVLSEDHAVFCSADDVSFPSANRLS